MKINKIIKYSLLTFVISIFLLTSCQKSDNKDLKIDVEVEKDTKEIQITKNETKEIQITKNNENPLKEDEAYSRLTGLPIKKEKIKRRPIAVMINNLKPATPSSGLKDAAIIYEAPVEGYITRFLAIFDDFDNIEKIGSIRSARTYYVRFCKEFDAYLMHVGQAYNAKKLLTKDNSITESLGGPIFRDKAKKAPHNAFTSGEKINSFFKKNNKLRATLSAESLNKNIFLFSEEDFDIEDSKNTGIANKIDLTSVYVVNKPYFEYDNNKKIYKRTQYGNIMKDANTNKELEFKNILIEFTNGHVFDKKGRWDIDETSGGCGYYFTNGKYKKIKWNFKNGRTHYLDDNTGKEISVNRGKTWVCIAINNKQKKLIIS